MSAGPSDRERISALEENTRRHENEIASLREKAHRHAQMIQTNTNDLEVFKAKLVGLAIGFGAASGLVAALAMRLLLN